MLSSVVLLISVVKNKYQIAYINATWGSTITLPCLPQSEGKSTWLKNKEEKIDYKVPSL